MNASIHPFHNVVSNIFFVSFHVWFCQVSSPIQILRIVKSEIVYLKFVGFPSSDTRPIKGIDTTIAQENQEHIFKQSIRYT